MTNVDRPENGVLQFSLIRVGEICKPVLVVRTSLVESSEPEDLALSAAGLLAEVSVEEIDSTEDTLLTVDNEILVLLIDIEEHWRHRETY